MSKHTAGPWRAVRNSCFWEIRPYNGNGEDIPFQIGDVCASEPSRYVNFIFNSDGKDSSIISWMPLDKRIRFADELLKKASEK